MLTRHYHTVANADGNGGLYDLRMYINDPATQEYLCSLNADCGGFVADGWWVAHSGITAVPMGSSSAMLDHGKGFVSSFVLPRGCHCLPAAIHPLLVPHPVGRVCKVLRPLFPPSLLALPPARYKPLGVVSLPYNGSTLYVRNATCAAVPCLVPASGFDDCAARCNCVWQSTVSTCGCIGLPGHPSCEQEFPTPNTTSIAAMGAS